ARGGDSTVVRPHDATALTKSLSEPHSDDPRLRREPDACLQLSQQSFLCAASRALQDKVRRCDKEKSCLSLLRRTVSLLHQNWSNRNSPPRFDMPDPRERVRPGPSLLQECGCLRDSSKTPCPAPPASRAPDYCLGRTS